MARTLITANTPTTSGLQVHTGVDIAADVANGNEFDNSGNVFLLVRNSDASAHTLTLNTPLAVDGTALPVRTVSITASSARWFGPFSPEIYNQTNGRVAIDSDSALLFFQCLRIPTVG